MPSIAGQRGLRTRQRSADWPGFWQSVTGSLDREDEPFVGAAIREVHEETGIIAEPVALMGVVDGMRMGFSRFGMYMLLFHMNATGG